MMLVIRDDSMKIRRLLKFLKRPFSISRKFVIYITFFVILSSVIYFGLFAKYYYNIKSTIYQNLENQSGRIENTFIDAIEYTEHSMNFIARQIVDNKKWNDYEFIKRLLVSYRIPDNRIMQFSTFAWANDKFRFIVSSNKGLHLDKQLYLLDRDYIPLTVSNPLKIQLGKPVYGIYSYKYAIPAGYGVVDKSGKYLGSVITSFVISSLERKFNEVININGVSFILTHKDGSFIAASPKTNHAEILKYLDSKKLEIASKEKGFIDDVSVFSDEGFGSIYYNKMKDYPYIIFTIYNQKLERAEIDKVVFNDIIIFCSLVVLVLLLFFLLYSSLVKPIIVIAKAAKSIADGNYEVEIAEYSSIEMNQLAKAILSIKKFVKKEELLKNQLSKVNKDLQQVTKSINHDLRNYAAGICGLANLINEEKDLAQISKYSHMIFKQSDGILRMAQELLSINLPKIDLKKTNLIEEFSIKEVLKELIFINQNFAAKHSVKISLILENEIPLISSDQIVVRRIFDNIITNAIKYSNENTEVKVLLSHVLAEHKIKVEVIDNGIGMTQNQIKMALDGEGAKIDKTGLAKVVDSHGFGLPIVKSLVHSIGAKIEIESKKFEGTKVKLWFDLDLNQVKDNSNQSSQDSQVSKDERVNKGIIMICDDELINRVVLDRILRNAGYKIFSVENGQEALELMDNKDFDLIFTDVKMPIIDGITMTKMIREGSQFKKFRNFNIPIIVISSNNDEDTKNKSLEAGASHYLDKIYDKSKILAVVEDLLK